MIPLCLKILAMADIISPWTVGRYSDPAGDAGYVENILKPDFVWCRQRGDRLFARGIPGFSWHNMYGGPSDKSPGCAVNFLWVAILRGKTS